jgi:periplasmic protein TonB
MEVSSLQLGLGFLFITLVIVGVIVGLRAMLASKSASDLEGQVADTERRPLLSNRVKYPSVDGFRFSGPLMLLGLAVALGITLLTISWTQYEKPVYIPDDALLLDETIEIEPPRTAEPPPPPPPPPPPVIEEVPEEEILEEEQPVFMDQTVEEETVIMEKPPEPKREAPPPPPPPPKEDVEEIFKVVEQMPRFPGCENISGTNEEKLKCAEGKMLEYIYKNVKYPAIARENGIQGRVVIQFVVERDGSITDAQVVRDIGAGCGEEALRVVNSMNSMSEKWTPGKQRGKPVRVQFTLPVQFKLQ